MGLFHLEEHWRRRSVLYGPEFTESIETIPVRQQQKYHNTWLCGSAPHSPFLCVEFDWILLKGRLLFSGLHSGPLRVVPQFVFLQTHFCCEHCLAVRAAVTQLLTFCGLMRTQTGGTNMILQRFLMAFDTLRQWRIIALCFRPRDVQLSTCKKLQSRQEQSLVTHPLAALIVVLDAIDAGKF